MVLTLLNDNGHHKKILLTNRDPKHQHEEDIRFKQLVHSVRMNEIIENDTNFLSEEMFENTYSMLKQKSGSKYDFILKGGTALKVALFKI